MNILQNIYFCDSESQFFGGVSNIYFDTTVV